MTSFLPKGRRRAGEMVYVNVYDLHPANDYGHSLGIGAYHSGLEVHGTEYSFGSGGGVFAGTPKEAGGAKFRESIQLGEVFISEREVRNIVDSMRGDFPGESYNVLTRNCNVFANELCKRLLDREIPGFINRLANLGSAFSCLLPPSVTGQAPVDGAGAGSGSGGGGGSYGSGRPAVPVFSGEGRSLATESSSSRPASTTSGAGGLTDRRALMMAAALKRAQADAVME